MNSFRFVNKKVRKSESDPISIQLFRDIEEPLDLMSSDQFYGLPGPILM